MKRETAIDIFGWIVAIVLAAVLCFGITVAARGDGPAAPALAVYSQPASDVNKWADRSVTIAIGWEKQLVNGTPSVALGQWEAAYATRGIKVIRESSGNFAADDADPNLVAVLWGTQELDNILVSINDQAVARHQDPAPQVEAAMAGMEAWTAGVRAACPHKKLAAVIGLEQFRWNKVDYKRIAKSFDYLIVDWYAVHRGLKPADLAALLAKFKADVAGDKLYAVCIECSLQHLSPSAYPNQRLPTAQEVTDELNAVAALGAVPCLFPQQIGEDGKVPFLYDAIPPELLAAIKAWVAARTPLPPPPATQPTTAPATSRPVWIVDGVSIPAPRSHRRTRVLCDGNPTPVGWNNPAWRGPADPDASGQPRITYNWCARPYMDSLGYESAFMVGNGTLNRAPCWARRDSGGNVLGDQYGRPDVAASMAAFQAALNWNWQGGDDRNVVINPISGKPNPSYCDPPEATALALVGQLAGRPGLYATAGGGNPSGSLRPGLPVVFDIEGTKTWTISPDASPDAKRLYLQRWLDAIHGVRATAGADQEVWIYGTEYIPWNVFGDKEASADPGVVALWYQLADNLSGWCSTAYLWDVIADNDVTAEGNASGGGGGGGGRWLAQAAWLETSVRRFAPQFAGGQKIVVLMPVYQVYNPVAHPRVAALDGKPIPFDEWCAMVDWYVDHGWSIYLWYGGYDLPERLGVRPQLAYASLYGLAPKGEAAKYLKALSEQNWRGN